MLNKLYIISFYTFKEILKSKVLLITLFIGFALMVITYVATEFTYGTPEKVALDFGLGMLSFSSLGIALFLGATLLPNEINSRTVYMVISRPVPRWVFILGKVLGLCGILFVNVLILSVMTLVCSALLGGEVSSVTLWAIIFNCLESLLLLLLVVFLSLFLNTTLSSVVSLFILILGHAIKETQTTSFVKERGYLNTMLEFYHMVLPGFYKLNLKDFVIYHKSIETSYLLGSAAYGVFYSLFLLVMIIFIFNKKNLD
ncbi:MAG TPA: hypothetical protein VKZ84_08005 [Bacteriovoracaceae bacterium]|nr:hypothetical protein [Bacteriovoracaceae bacterium]